jgi:hypothetical protein
MTAAAWALRAGDPLGALKRVALRDDAPALALRGIAMAQLGELDKARALLQRAARGFGSRERLARARCLAAQAEVALAARELGWPARDLDEAVRVFAAHGDRANLQHARLLQVRRLLLLGRVAEAEAALARLTRAQLPARLAAIAELLRFETAVRRGSTAPARAALARAHEASARAHIPALSAEIARAGRALELPAATLVSRGGARPLLLAEVERTLASPQLIVDACRRALRCRRLVVSLARRPVLFALLRALAEAWPGAATRGLLIERAFGARRANDSHRARLRVELGRLRRQARPLAEVRATGEGFALVAVAAPTVVLLAPPVDGPGPGAAALALLADGEAWSTSALALALGASQRTVQRSLSALEAAGQVRGLGRARARRWMAPPVVGFTTTLLLPPPPALGYAGEHEQDADA